VLEQGLVLWYHRNLVGGCLVGKVVDGMWGMQGHHLMLHGVV
jgi:hypothetical protein